MALHSLSQHQLLMLALILHNWNAMHIVIGAIDGSKHENQQAHGWYRVYLNAEYCNRIRQQ